MSGKGNGNGDNGTEDGVTEEQQRAWDEYQRALREKQNNPKEN